MDELEHAKKKSCENVNILGWTPTPPVVKIHNFFFTNESFPNVNSLEHIVILYIHRVKSH